MSKKDLNSKCNLIYQQKAGVYCILNTVNNKFYIGSVVKSEKGNCFRRRWLGHLSSLKGNRHVNRHLQYSYNKYGENSFQFLILEIVEEKDKIHEREQFWIDKTQCVKLGYNVNAQAICVNKNYTVKENTKEKLSKHFKGKSRPEWMKRLYGKSILQFTKDGTFIKEYYSMTEAAKAINIHRTAIGDVAREKYKSAGGFIWKYKSLDDIV